MIFVAVSFMDDGQVADWLTKLQVNAPAGLFFIVSPRYHEKEARRGISDELLKTFMLMNTEKDLLSEIYQWWYSFFFFVCVC